MSPIIKVLPVLLGLQMFLMLMEYVLKHFLAA
jgi:hypothetical protein